MVTQRTCKKHVFHGVFFLKYIQCLVLCFGSVFEKNLKFKIFYLLQINIFFDVFI